MTTEKYLNNYRDVESKLDKFLASNLIPNIIFHGNSNSQKEDIVVNFLHKIYDNQESINKYTMIVNCAHGKGIKFVREDLKHFAKTNIRTNMFKSIVMFNADKLTIDAQSALRRCIEIFSHSTRFFMVVDDISRLLEPIHSRFCNIHIIDYQGNICNQYEETIKMAYLKRVLKTLSVSNIFQTAEKIYNKGIIGLNLLRYIEQVKCCDKYYQMLFHFNNVKTEIRNERQFILYTLYYILNPVEYREAIL